MNIGVADMTVTSIETATAYALVTGDFLFTLDELQNITMNQSEEETEITGKQGRKLNSLKKNKAVTISGTSGFISGGLLALQTGNEFETNVRTKVRWMETLTVDNNTATSTYPAIGTVGAEIVSVHVKNSDGTLGESFTQGATTFTAGVFTYNIATQAFTFVTDEVDTGTEIFVCYDRYITGSKLENLSDSYSGKCELYIDAFAEDVCGKTYYVQFRIPKANLKGNFDLAMGDNQTTHAFEMEALAGGCGTDSNGTYWTYTIFDTDE